MTPQRSGQKSYAQVVKDQSGKKEQERVASHTDWPKPGEAPFSSARRNVTASGKLAIQYSEEDFRRSIYVAGKFTDLAETLSQRKRSGVELEGRTVIGVDTSGQFVPVGQSVNEQQQANMELSIGAFYTRVGEWQKVLRSQQAMAQVNTPEVRLSATVEYFSKQIIPYMKRCGFIVLYQHEKDWIEAIKRTGSSQDLCTAQNIIGCVLDDYCFQEGCELKDYLSGFYDHLKCVFKEDPKYLEDIQEIWSDWYEFERRQASHLEEATVPQGEAQGLLVESGMIQHGNVASGFSGQVPGNYEQSAALSDDFQQLALAESRESEKVPSGITTYPLPQRQYRPQARRPHPGERDELPARASKYSKRHIFDISVVLQEVKNRRINDTSSFVLLKRGGKVAFCRQLKGEYDVQKARNFIQSLYAFELRREEMVKWFAATTPYFVRIRRNQAYEDINSARIDNSIWILEQSDEHPLSEIHRAESVLINNLLRAVHGREGVKYDVETLTERVFNFVSSEALHLRGEGDIAAYYRDVLLWCRHNVSNQVENIEVVRNAFNESLRLLHNLECIREYQELL